MDFECHINEFISMLRGWCDLGWQDFYQGIIIFCHPTITRLFQKSKWMKLFVLIIFKVRGRYNHGTILSIAGIVKGTLCVLVFSKPSHYF